MARAKSMVRWGSGPGGPPRARQMGGPVLALPQNVIPGAIPPGGPRASYGLLGGLLGAVGGFITGGPVGAVAGAIGGYSSGGAPPPPPPPPPPQTGGSVWANLANRIPGIVSSQPSVCQPPLVMDVDGQCRAPGSPADVSVGGGMRGIVVEGVYGPALTPETENTVVRRCPPGFHLGHDDLCYEKLYKGERKWPAPRKPLLSGGDLNAIAKARRAAKRLEARTGALEEMGMLKRKVRTRTIKK